MGRLPYHHYLPQYIIMVDIGNRFRNIQQIKQCQFSIVLYRGFQKQWTENVCIPMEEDQHYVEIAVLSLVNSICNNSGYTKHIHKRTRNKTVPVSTVFYCLFKHQQTENICIRIVKEKYYSEIAISSLPISICNNDGYTKEIHKFTRNKMVSVSIVFYCVFEKQQTEKFAYGWRKKNIMRRLLTINTTHNEFTTCFSCQLQITILNNNNINLNKRKRYLIFDLQYLWFTY